MLASDVLTRVRTQLIDTRQPYRWLDDELLLWLTDAQRAVVTAVPDTTATFVGAFPLAASARQTLPPNTNRLLTIHYSGLLGELQNPTSTSKFYTMRLAERDQLDAVDPFWRNRRANRPPDTYVYDPLSPLDFWVTPTPAVSNTYAVAMNLSIMPSSVSTLTTPLVLTDRWMDALVNYVMFRAHSKETAHAGGLALAQTYKALFEDEVRRSEAADVITNPNLQIGPMVPDVKGAAR